jgi:hypothetical protein
MKKILGAMSAFLLIAGVTEASISYDFSGIRL